MTKDRGGGTNSKCRQIWNETNNTTVVALYYDVKISVVITSNLYFPYKVDFFSQYEEIENGDIRCCPQNRCSQQKKHKNIQNIYCFSAKFVIERVRNKERPL